MLNRPAIGAGMFNGLGNLAIKAVSGLPECGGIDCGTLQQLPSGIANRTWRRRRWFIRLGKLRFDTQSIPKRLIALLTPMSSHLPL